MITPKIVAAFFILGVVGGCSSTPKANFDLSQRRVTIRTEPTTARVTQVRPLNQASLVLGVTPLVDRPVMVFTNIKMKSMPFKESQALLEHADNLVVLIEKDGYEPYRATIATRPNEVSEYSIQLTPKSGK